MQYINSKAKNCRSTATKAHLVNPPSANVAYLEEKQTNKYKVQNQNPEVQGLLNLQNLTTSAYCNNYRYVYQVTFHRTTLSQCVHHVDAGFWHITALSAPNISHHRLHNTQEYWQHEALETYITYIAGLLHKTNIFQDYTFSVINGDYANQSLFLCTKFYTP